MLQYGDITRDPGKLPASSAAALMARGFAHLLGNEQASKVVTRIRNAIVDSANAGKLETEHRKVDSVTRDEVQAFRAANAEIINAWNAEAVGAALKELDEGTLGVRAAGGPRVDPVTQAMNSAARAEVITTLKANGIKVPKGDEVVTFGNGETRTMPQMIAKRLEVHGERLRKEAEKAVADAARKRAKIEAEAKGKGTASAAELGL